MTLNTITLHFPVGFCNYTTYFTCDEKEGQLQLIGQSPATINDEVYDEILKCLRANMILKCRHNMSSSKKRFTTS